MTVKLCAIDVMHRLRFSKCPHVNHDHNLVAVNSALEN